MKETYNLQYIIVMVIKNKDGSVYKLQGPNPLMEDQSFWNDLENFTLHNTEWKKTIFGDDGELIPRNNDFQVDVASPVAEPDLEKPKSNPPEVVLPPMPDTPVETIKEVKNEPKEIPKDDNKLPVIKNKVIIHCLPASTKEHFDDFYGEHYNKISYGDKFSFEAVIVENEDLAMTFWTTTDKVTPASVVYPQVGEKRWWRVQTKIEKSGGYLIYAIISDIQPDFSN
jgi:hypothetical protein